MSSGKEQQCLRTQKIGTLPQKSEARTPSDSFVRLDQPPVGNTLQKRRSTLSWKASGVLASFTNLTTLFLDGNQISDISPLASLTNP